MLLAQFGGDLLTNLIWILLFFLMIFFYPKMMISQVIFRLERSFLLVYGLAQSSKKMILRKLPKRTKEIKEALNNFLEFFVVEPVNLDPFGIIKKYEHLLNLELSKFKYFVKRIAPTLKENERMNLIMGIIGAMNLHQTAKIIRHYIEFIKKTKNYQIGLLIQMQMPLIERISKAMHKGVEAFVNAWPIGDSIGAFVAASISKGKPKEILEDTVLVETRLFGKKVLILKAKGPGGSLGKLGRAVELLVKKRKIEKIITIDAALKLEGEKTGSIAEGIGVAMGGIGVDRSFIEEIATKNKIPLDSIVIKMSNEEAIMPMKKEILEGGKKALERLIKNIKESEGKGYILVVGVGNTVGIGNTEKDAKEAESKILKTYEMLSKRENYWEEKPKKSFWDQLFGI